MDDPTPALHPSTAGHRSDTFAVGIHAAHTPPPPPLASETPGQPTQGSSYLRRPGVVIILLIVFSVVSITAIALGLSYLLLSPKNPKFAVSTIMVTHQWAKHPRVLILLKAKNPNNRVGVFYEAGGSAALTYKNRSFASGPFPTFFQGKKDSRMVSLFLRAANKTMPRKVRESILNNTAKLKPLSLALTMNVPVRMKILTSKIWIQELVFDCKFKVNSLSNTSRILRQQCPLKVAPK